MTDIQKRLFELQDREYKDFNSRLIPTVDPELVIGVRTPELRRLGKSLAKEPDIDIFLRSLPHTYYEENNLHGFIIETIKDFDKCVEALDAFLPYVDNWATCDQMSPRALKKNPAKLLDKVRQWIASGKVYTVRFGIGVLMRYYLDDGFLPDYLEMAADIKSDEYYINMMIAWYFATALAKQYEAALPYIEKERLEPWTHNKAIQKAVESRRITEEKKAYLRTLKRKM